MSELKDILERAGEQLPGGVRTTLRPLLTDELLDCLAARLETLHEANGLLERQPPFFDEETTPPLGEAFGPFADAMSRWASVSDSPDDSLEPSFVAALQIVRFDQLLHLLGMRTTSASVTDSRAVPPARALLLSAAGDVCDGTSALSVAARALDKHVARGDDSFWGSLSGSEADKSARARSLLVELLEQRTWWNVFTHFQHGLVYEVRVASGHGARWTHDGRKFVGFIDPFDRERRSDALSTSDDRVDSNPSNGPMATDTQNCEPLPDHPTREEIESRYATGQRSFQHVDLSGIDLQGLDLRGIDLTGSNLRRAKLFGTNLEGATLTECDLRGVYLAGTHLSGVTARRASFQECRMDQVTWHDLDLEGARFDRANLRGATLTNCSLKRSGWADADLSEIRLTNARLYGAFVERACWSGASLENCRMNNARLGSCDFSEARLERCVFEGADLSEARFHKAQLIGCRFKDANGTGAEFADCQLEHAIFDGANLTAARMTYCRLSEASCVRANFSRASLNNADLEGSQLTQADLSRADLREANLVRTNLDGADLSSADIVGTTVDDATSFKAAKTIGVDFGTNWILRQRVLESSHELTIEHFCRQHPVLGFLWWAMLGYGKHNSLLLVWGTAIVLAFAGLMAWSPSSFDFGQANPSFLDHCRNSLAVFVTLDLAVDKGTDTYGRAVMLVQMLLSYLMLGFMASLFSSIFPRNPD